MPVQVGYGADRAFTKGFWQQAVHSSCMKNGAEDSAVLLPDAQAPRLTKPLLASAAVRKTDNPKLAHPFSAKGTGNYGAGGKAQMGLCVRQEYR